MPSSSLPLRVLVVDDEKNIRDTLLQYLEGLGCQAAAASSAEGALAMLRSQRFDLAFLDLRLGETNGLGIIPDLLETSPELSIVVITAYATIDTAVEAIRRGAQDYLPKPFRPEQIDQVVRHASERRELSSRVSELEARLRDAAPETDLETGSGKMRAALEVLLRSAHSDAPVLLRGESGTGKGVLARVLHARSPRSSGPFIVVNCPILSGELLAGELFGHARGAFTGAVGEQAGRVEAADGGTLFLDEIGEIPPTLQGKLLRFLQEKEFERLGENKTRRANVRVVAATNRDLDADVQNGRFREDLLYRLNVVEVCLPPLRERPEDILRLAGRFLVFFARAARRPVQELSKSTRRALLAYSWPGNIRELRNAIERAVILWPAQVIEPQALPERIAAKVTSRPYLGGDFSLEEIEREHISKVVARTQTLEEAAKILGIDPSTLWRKRKKSDE
jgi:NtrC-family two-component system response regulator AlgB